MSTKPKICFITASELTVRWFLLDQLSALSHFYDVTLIVNTSNPEFLNDTHIPLRVIPLRIERKINLWSDGEAFLKLMRILWRERFSALHSVTPKAGLLAMVAATLCCIPIRIHTFQGEVWANRTGLMRQLLRFFDRWVGRLATYLLVVSASERRFLIEEGVISADKSRVLAHGSICGIDTRRFVTVSETRLQKRQGFNIPATDAVFLFLGRLAVDKGILDLVEAFNRLWGANPGVSLLIVGPDEERIKEKVLSMNLPCGAAIRFYEATRTPESYIEITDVLCLPSYREGFGMVLLEAASMGIPVLASRIYGITDAVIENETGLLHAPGAVEEITDKMSLLANDADLRKRLGERATQRAQRDFSQDYVTSEVVKFYESAIGKL